MTLTGFLILLLIAAICGSVAQAIVGYSRGGCLVSAALGLIGALIGTWLARLFELPYGFEVNIDGQEFPVIWSIVGAALFVAVLSLLTYRRPTPL
ncbi:MAG TPA: GlsB/YeaQ/YmgE family stress response membrane protein [Pirellulales bacterium]|nr:GlsB/YeaQ/YmgE family stress response membrane protein [Pirellulales bacterium]